MPEPVLRVRAYAKVNLSLEVIGRRDDGFHELVSIVQTISLHDLVECVPAPTLHVATIPPLVAPDENLASRAAELLAHETARAPAAVLRIHKRIPLAAGLGGGSSDAAASLRLLDRLWSTRCDRDTLVRLGATLGSDVPFFLFGGAALMRGRGERIDPLPSARPFWLALAMPPPPPSLGDKTRALYRALTPRDWGDGRQTLELADALRSGESPLGRPLPNSFDRAAASIYPGFAELRRRLADATGVPVQISGSGPSLFVLFASGVEAAAAADRMAHLGVPTRVARSVATSRITTRYPHSSNGASILPLAR
jgi:4-diphosphocytidyl-2-C-methyl-D-erythritol kinase